MNKLHLLWGALALSATSAWAGSYKPLTCQGQMPAQMQHLLGSDNLTETESDVKSIFRTGNILYGTPLNAYVDSIANILFKANPSPEQEKVNIYLYKTDEVNAFVCKDGTLFMNVGMLAQASSEAELALVMAHELSHFYKHHGAVVDKKKLRKASDAVDYMLKKSQQSRDNEFEADSYALTGFIKNTNYSKESVPGLYDLLQYGYLPFDEEPFNRSYVETADYHFPDDYFLTKLNPISSREDYVDTLSTHPNLKKRRQNADELVKSWNDDGHSEFILSESSFDRMRLAARKEVVNILLNNNEFGEAFYNNYVLMAENPNDPELKTFAAQALYGLAKYAEASEKSDVIPDYKKTEGESGAAYYFLHKMSKKELALLALRFAWDAQKVNPDVKPITKSLMTMVRDYKLDMSNFSDFAMGTSMADAQKKVDAKFETVAKPVVEEKVTESASVKVADKSDANKSSKNKRKRNISSSTKSDETASAKTSKKRDSKYDNIKQKQARESFVLPDSDFTALNYMLVDLKSDSAFVSMFNASAKSDEQKDVKSALDHYTTSNQMAYDGGKVLLVTYYFSDNKSTAKKDKLMQDNVISWGSKHGMSFICYEQLLKNAPTTKNYNLYNYISDFQVQRMVSTGKNMVHMPNPVLDSVLAADGVTQMLDLRVYDRVSDKFRMHGFCAGLAIPCAMPAIVGAGFVNQRDVKVSASLHSLKDDSADYKEVGTFSKYNTQSKLDEFLYSFILTISKGGKK